MRRGIVTAKRNAQSKKEYGEPHIAGTEAGKAKEQHEQEHLDDEHALAAEVVRQAAKTDRADENTE